MDEVAAAGPWSVMADALRTLLANVLFFQTWTHEADAAGALKHIFLGEIGVPIVSLAISGGVLTVVLREPVELTVGQVVTVEGASIGPEGTGVWGVYTIAAVGTTDALPWTDRYGNTWYQSGGSPWTYDSGQARTFTVSGLSFDDLASFEPTEATLLLCARPFAVIVDADDPVRAESVATDLANVAGALEILIEDRVSTAYRNDARNAMIDARNNFGQLVQGLQALAGTADYALLNSVDMVRGPTFLGVEGQETNAGRFEKWQALLRVTWGLNG